MKKKATASRVPKAKTAYELLERVCAHILEEPKRYYQNMWVIRDPARIARMFGVDAGPACGTVACRAGWIVALHDGVRAANRLAVRQNMWRYDLVADRANAILGRATTDTRKLFGPHSGRVVALGTRAYAKVGVAGLQRFMKRHAAHLKARSLKGV